MKLWISLHFWQKEEGIILTNWIFEVFWLFSSDLKSTCPLFNVYTFQFYTQYSNYLFIVHNT